MSSSPRSSGFGLPVFFVRITVTLIVVVLLLAHVIARAEPLALATVLIVVVFAHYSAKTQW